MAITRVAILQQQNLHREVVGVIAGAARKLAAIYFPVYALLMVVGPEFIRFLFTQRYAGSWPIFAINLTLLPLNIVLLDALLRSYASERYFVLRLRMAILSTLVLVLWFWTRELGLTGVIATVVGAGIVERTTMAIRFGSLLGVTRQDARLLKDVGKLALAAAVAGLTCAALRLTIAGTAPLIVLAVCGTVFLAIYLAGIHFLGILAADEYGMIRRGVERFLPHSLRNRPAV